MATTNQITRPDGQPPGPATKPVRGSAPPPGSRTATPRGVALRRAMVAGLCRRGMSLVCRPTAVGVERVPSEGPFLLIFNHTSNFDPPLLRWAVPRPDLVGIVAASYRSRPLIRLVVEASGSIWIRRGAGDWEALRAALTVLRSGGCLGISPEGGRSRDAAMRRARRGAAVLALDAGVPVVPAGITGAAGIRPALRRGGRARVTVRFGLPFHVEPLGPGPRGGDRFQQRVDAMMARVAELLPPAYRGVYGRGS